MICEKCHGKGRIVSKVGIGTGHHVQVVDHIDLCIDCMGSGIVSCCDGAGSREAVLLACSDVNPNEAS